MTPQGLIRMSRNELSLLTQLDAMNGVTTILSNKCFNYYCTCYVEHNRFHTQNSWLKCIAYFALDKNVLVKMASGAGILGSHLYVKSAKQTLVHESKSLWALFAWLLRGILCTGPVLGKQKKHTQVPIKWVNSHITGFPNDFLIFASMWRVY